MCLATGSSFYISVKFINTSDVSGAAATSRFMPAFYSLGDSNETGSKFSSTAFLDFANMPRILSWMKLVRTRLLPASFPKRVKVAFVNGSSMCTCTSVFTVMSN